MQSSIQSHRFQPHQPHPHSLLHPLQHNAHLRSGSHQLQVDPLIEHQLSSNISSISTPSHLSRNSYMDPTGHVIDPVAGPSGSPTVSNIPGPSSLDPGLTDTGSPINTTPHRKKGGRGPGKKEKDKPAVSVRWEEADLTDRLVTALENNDRWVAVLSQSGPEHARAVIGVPKKDLQREIARYLFQNDTRYDLEDKKTVEALAVSIKNKLFKIQNLYTECRNELTPFILECKDERDIPPDSEQFRIWNRVKDKLPQFFRVRDLMNRPLPPIPPSSSSRHDDAFLSSTGEVSASVSRPVPTPHTTRSTSGSGSMASTGIRVSVDLGREGISIPYVEASPIANGQDQTSTHPQAHTLQHTAPTNTFRYPPPPHPPPPRGPYHVPTSPYSSSPQQSSSAHMIHQPQPRMPGGPYSSSPLNPQPPRHPHTHLRSSPPPAPFRLSVSPSPPPPSASPPLSQTVAEIVKALDSKKRSREETWLSIKRIKLEEREKIREREEREKIRYHEREMMRLQIRLARVQRGEMIESDDMETDSGLLGGPSNTSGLSNLPESSGDMSGPGPSRGGTAGSAQT